MLKNELNLEEKFFFCLNNNKSDSGSSSASTGYFSNESPTSRVFNPSTMMTSSGSITPSVGYRKLVHAKGVKLDATSLSSLSSASSSPASSPPSTSPSFLHLIPTSVPPATTSMPGVSSHNHSNSYLCKDCFRTFKDVNNFKEHRFQEHHIREYPNVKKCKLCSYATLLKSKYDCHMRCHLNNKIIRCQKCDYSTINIRHMSRHERMHMISMSSQTKRDDKPTCSENNNINKQQQPTVSSSNSKFMNKKFKSNNSEAHRTINSNNNNNTSADTYTSLKNPQSDLNRQNLELITRAIMTNNNMCSGATNNPLSSLLLAARVTDFNVLMQQQQQQQQQESDNNQLLNSNINAEFRKNMLNILAVLMPQFVNSLNDNKSQLDEMIDYMANTSNNFNGSSNTSS